MEMINKKEQQFVFKANIDETLANAVRRYLNQVLVLAIDEVEIMKNDSALYDETVAHRVGLVPLKTEGPVDEKTTANLKLVNGKEGVVFSGDITGKIKVVYDKIPLTILNKGQELELVANVRAGTGAEHSKFSPGIMFYRNVTEIVMDKSVADEIKKYCPGIDMKEKGDKIVVVDDGKNEICDVCEGICKEKGKDFETTKKDELVVVLESFGQIPVKDLFKKSVAVLKKDLAEVSKKVK